MKPERCLVYLAIRVVFCPCSNMQSPEQSGLRGRWRGVSLNTFTKKSYFTQCYIMNRQWRQTTIRDKLEEGCIAESLSDAWLNSPTLNINSLNIKPFIIFTDYEHYYSFSLFKTLVFIFSLKFGEGFVRDLKKKVLLSQIGIGSSQFFFLCSY